MLKKIVKKSELMKMLKNQGLDYYELKKEMGISLKKGKPLMEQLILQSLKKISSAKSELMPLISPKNLIESHESKMLGKDLREEAYEAIKALSLLSWVVKKAELKSAEEAIMSLKKSMDYFKSLKILKERLCNEMIDNWNKEDIKDNYYIS
jgi:hypothetical protein